jgi:hypothetical protein
MPAAPNHYHILNVAPDAEAVVIEAAYRALMKKYHPDQAATAAVPGPSAAAINQAYATLRNPERRAEYDRRERTRLQSVQLAAAYRPPPPQRVLRAFGWGGWIVALVLGGILATMAQRANELAFAQAEVARASASSEPDFRTQPTLPDEPMVSPAVLARAKSGRVPALPIDPRALAEAPHAQAAAPPAPAADLNAAAPQAERKAGRAKPRRPQAQARARTAAEKDFLEREGYIY